HDVIINEEDCGTLRGLVCREIKNNDEVVTGVVLPIDAGFAAYSGV
ncbi:MAG: hypothetical protein HFH43_12980, partial [Lachnospiraceae bacterium]|nr:hypothetical protein [Lachnospiraceae bacterium]